MKPSATDRQLVRFWCPVEIEATYGIEGIELARAKRDGYFPSGNLVEFLGRELLEYIQRNDHTN